MTPRDDEPTIAESLDRLVDGELDDEARRDLLARFESEPGGWRRCALAFLEAQSWRRAMAAHAAAPAVPAIVSPPRPRIGPWLARAATLLLAFGLGWAMRPAPAPRAIVAPPPIAMPAPSPIRPTPRVAEAPSDRPASPPGYVQGLLERGGYRVEQRTLLVPAATKDGRRFAVPVEQVKLRFVGNRAV